MKNEFTGYLVERYEDMGSAYTCRRFAEEAARRGMELTIVGAHDLSVSKDGVISHGQVLGRRDFCINRYKWGALKDTVNALADRSYNELSAFSRYINKFEQVKRIHSDAFRIPDYLLVLSGYDFDSITERVGLPFVAKGLESSMGQEIFLVEKKEDWEKICSRYSSEKEWLIEEYISTSYGRDMRMYTVRGEVIGVMERRSEGDFRANVALGAQVRQLEINDTFRKAARDIYDETHLDFLGIDLLYGSDIPWFCEINVMPGIEGMEKATGVNIAGSVTERIYQDLRAERTLS